MSTVELYSVHLEVGRSELLSHETDRLIKTMQSKLNVKCR